MRLPGLRSVEPPGLATFPPPRRFGVMVAFSLGPALLADVALVTLRVGARFEAEEPGGDQDLRGPAGG